MRTIDIAGKTTLSALLAVSAALSPLSAAGADLEPLRAKVAAAYGADSAAELRGYRARGRILQMKSGIGGTVELSVWLEGSLRSETRYPAGTEVRILQGPLAWSGGRGRQTFAPREAADAIRLQFHRLAAPFELLSAPADELALDGETAEGWVRVARRWDDRTRTVYEIDPESGRIRRIRGELTDADGGTLRFDSEDHDFREVDGVTFPFRTTTIVDGEITAEIVLERITPADKYRAAEFRPSDAAGDI